MKKLSFAFAGLFLAGFLVLPGLASAATPTLSLTLANDGDSVTVTVNGDANANVLLYYTKTNVGATIASLGTTSVSGNFTTIISSSSYGIASSTLVYVKTGTLDGPQSSQVYWPTLSSSTSGNISLSQSGVVVTAGQSSVITVTNAGSSLIYLFNNSNPSIANININNNQVTILGNTSGTTVATLCLVGGTSNCASVFVKVQASGAGTLTFNQNNVSVSSGQSVPITVTGGTGLYLISNNSNSNIIQASINGSVVTLTTSNTSGSSSIVVCTTDNSSCGVINATAGSSNSSSVSFSQSNPNLSVGQSTVISIYGTSGSYYYVSANTNPNIVQANINSSSLTLIGSAIGTSTITVCASGGACAQIVATINNTSSNSAITLSQSSISLSVGQTLTVTVSGGIMPYNVYTSSSASSIVQAILNNNIVTLNGISAGTTSVDVCPSIGGGGCTSLSVNVGGTATASQPIFNQNNLSLILGQGTNVNITGAGNYYVATNSNPSVASVTISASTAMILALSAGTANVSICQTGGQCTILFVTVSIANTPAVPITPVVPETPAVTPEVVAPSYIFTKNLSLGSTGQDVLELQKFLNNNGFVIATSGVGSTGHENKSFGAKTKAALIKFQKAKKISPAIGNFYSVTRKLVNSLMTTSGGLE